MATLDGIATFKNAVRGTLQRSKVSPRLAPTIPGSATSVVTRHDHHNIEIKTVSELGNTPSLVETDIYLFVPRSFEIAALGKSELIKDFRNRMRLALPMVEEQGVAAFETALASVRTGLVKIETLERSGEPVLELDHPFCSELLEASKDLCSILSETLKRAGAEHRRQFFLSHTLMTTAGASQRGLETLSEQVASISRLIERARSLECTNVAASSVLTLLDEYISQLYVQYLSTVRFEISEIETPKPSTGDECYSEARIQLLGLLDDLQAKEARHRLKFGGPPADTESDLERERRLVRLSHLKKFFQSRTFVEITRRTTVRKFKESTAWAGTAFAGLAAALLERYSRPEIGDVAVNGSFVLAFGVIAYVFKDRLKDRAKTLFHEKASQLLPDFEQQLMARDKRIGSVKEWFRILSPKSLPEEIIKLRRKASASEMEVRLPEDVFHCRKVQEVNAAALVSSEGLPLGRALHENIRVNFERHLKHMDDPFKVFTDLDPSGRFLRSNSHRVYHFYLCVRTVCRPLPEPGPRSEQTLVYRIVLDKTGLVRLEEITKRI